MNPFYFYHLAQCLLNSHGAKKLRHKGQGVIEYAGALVIATALVGAILSVGPAGISTLFTTILTSVQTFFTSKLPT